MTFISIKWIYELFYKRRPIIVVWPVSNTQCFCGVRPHRGIFFLGGGRRRGKYIQQQTGHAVWSRSSLFGVCVSSAVGGVLLPAKLQLSPTDWLWFWPGSAGKHGQKWAQHVRMDYWLLVHVSVNWRVIRFFFLSHWFLGAFRWTIQQLSTSVSVLLACDPSLITLISGCKHSKLTHILFRWTIQ